MMTGNFMVFQSQCYILATRKAVHWLEVQLKWGKDIEQD